MSLSIKIPESILLSTRQNIREFEIAAKRAIALNFYADERLSLGQAAELAELSKFEFMKYLGDKGVSLFRYEGDCGEELQNDMMAAKGFVHG